MKKLIYSLLKSVPVLALLLPITSKTVGQLSDMFQFNNMKIKPKPQINMNWAAFCFMEARPYDETYNLKKTVKDLQATVSKLENVCERFKKLARK